MKTSDFNYELTARSSIAQTPIPQRDASRLLTLDKHHRRHGSTTTFTTCRSFSGRGTA